MRLGRPEPLAAGHDLSRFKCGQPVLDDWLRRRALAAMTAGSARSYVVCAGESVAAFYCLAVGAVAHAGAPGRGRRNMPDPVPVMVVGRLAVDSAWQGRGLGRAMLADALLRTLGVAEVAGVRALLVHALDERAAAFYLGGGFLPSPVDPLTLMITRADARTALEPS